MKIDGDWIRTPATQQVCAILDKAGYQGLLVGGCVRNALIGAPVGDIDIATDARPETVMSLCEQAGLKVVPTGLDHGTVTVVADHIPHEVTTFRHDVQTDGRRAVVAFASDVTQDARRRDFTMNALYARADGKVIDPLDGLPDLKARRVRFIEDPGQRIREDYLRILRFFRFHAWYGDPAGGLDADGLAACAEHVDQLSGLSRERVGAEMLKLLAAPDPAQSLAAMRQAGVLAAILPGATDRALAPLVHLEDQAGVKPDALRRLAALGGEDVADRLRLSRKQAGVLQKLHAAMTGTAGPAELGYRLGEDTGRDVLLLRQALSGQPFDVSWNADLSKGAAARFPVSARDLMPEVTGAELGRKLQDLESRWIASGFELTRRDLLG